VEALKWLQKAANQNNNDAQVDLAKIYCISRGIVEAYAWCLISGDRDLEWTRSQCQSAMSPEQRAKAEKRAIELRFLIDSKTKLKSNTTP